jgi:hypothetical protein
MTRYIIALLFAIFILTACGPSAEQRRQQEIEDSIQLEKDRRELLERAGRMLETPTKTAGEENDKDTIQAK